MKRIPPSPPAPRRNPGLPVAGGWMRGGAPGAGVARRAGTFGLGRSVAMFLLLAAAQAQAQATSTPAQPFVVESVSVIEAGVGVLAPKWSPDGKWIAFSAPKAEGIGLVRPDGAGLRMLTVEPGSGYQFAWSPDSARIAFRTAQREGGPRHYVIRVIDVATGEIESSSAVIPDAQPPVWQRGAAGARWASHSPAGPVEGAWSASVPLDPPLSATPWPENPPLIEQRGFELWLHDADPAKRRKLSGEFGLNPVWTRDGTRFVYDAMDRFVVASAEGTSLPAVVGLNPAWSPDGRWLVYQITADHSHAEDDTRRHTADTLPHFHDDKTNHRIVDSELWIIGAEGTGRFQLTRTPDVLECDPDWSPDGGLIVCRDDDTGKLRVLKLAKP